MIIQFFIFILFITTNLFAINITVKAISIYKHRDILILDKDIFIKIGQNIIKADKATCFLKKFKIIKCKLIGNLKFKIFEKKILKYKGKANSLEYILKTNIYTYSGDVFIKDLINKNIMKGDKIKIDMNNNGNLEIKGTKKRPVNINFNL